MRFPAVYKYWSINIVDALVHKNVIKDISNPVWKCMELNFKKGEFISPANIVWSDD